MEKDSDNTMVENIKLYNMIIFTQTIYFRMIFMEGIFLLFYFYWSYTIILVSDCSCASYILNNVWWEHRNKNLSLVKKLFLEYLEIYIYSYENET